MHVNEFQLSAPSPPTRPTTRPAMGPTGLLALQRAVGNRQVTRALTEVVQRCGPIPPSECPCHDGEEAVSAQRVACDTTPCDRPRGERVAAESAAHRVVEIADPDASGTLVGNFTIGSAQVKSGRLESDRTWRNVVITISNSRNITWRLLGFTDCGGGQSLNTGLRSERAENIRRILPAAARAKVSEARGADLGECMAGNTDSLDRELNRSVFIRPADRTLTFPPETVPAPRRRRGSPVCGPDVTAGIGQTLRAMHGYFGDLPHREKCDHCSTLHGPGPTALGAWDTVELYCGNADWIDVLSRIGRCATPAFPNASPCNEPASGCRHSVRHSGKCVLAGTLNYFTWGQMHRLCRDYAVTPENRVHPNHIDAEDFGESRMETFISLYKGWGLVEDPSAPKAFARAAFAAQDAAVPPIENRAHCRGSCSERWAQHVRPSPFTWTWLPGRYQS